MLLPAGVILEKYGPRNIYPAAFLISAVGVLIFSYAHSLPIILFSRVISGASASFALLGGINIARLLFNIKKTQLVTSLILAGHICGDMLAQFPLMYLISEFGWRGSLFMIAISGIAFSSVVYFVLKKLIKQKKRDFSVKKIILSLSNIISNKIIWLGALIVMMFQLPAFLLGTFFGNMFLISNYDLTPLNVSGLFSLFYIVLMVATPLYGYVWRNISFSRSATTLCVILIITSVICIFYIVPIMLYCPYVPFILLAIGTPVRNVGYFILIEKIDRRALALSNSCMSLLIVFFATISRPLIGFIIEYNCHPNCNNQKLLFEDYQRGGLFLIIALLLGTIALCCALRKRNND